MIDRSSSIPINEQLARIEREAVERMKQATEAAHWQNVRERAAIANHAALLAHYGNSGNMELAAEHAKEHASALVAALKGGQP
jgi:hypothetical protein